MASKLKRLLWELLIFASRSLLEQNIFVNLLSLSLKSSKDHFTAKLRSRASSGLAARFRVSLAHSGNCRKNRVCSESNACKRKPLQRLPASAFNIGLDVNSSSSSKCSITKVVSCHPVMRTALYLNNICTERHAHPKSTSHSTDSERAKRVLDYDTSHFMPPGMTSAGKWRLWSGHSLWDPANGPFLALYIADSWDSCNTLEQKLLQNSS